MALIKKECEDCVLGLDKKNNELQEATKTVKASVTVLESKDDELSNLREKYKDLLIKFEDASKQWLINIPQNGRVAICIKK